MNVRKAIIPAAGYGTRSLPITKVLPKEMFPIAGKPAIHYIVEEAVAAGIEEVLIIVSRNKNVILDYFDRSLELEAFLAINNKEYLLEKTTLPKVHIQYIRQPFARGLGDAVLLGERFAHGEPFAVLLPDDFFVTGGGVGALEQLVERFYKTGKSTVAVQKMEKAALHQYGVIKPGQAQSGEASDITDIVEKPKVDPPSDLAVCGRYVFTPELFSCLHSVLPGAGGEIQLTDGIRSMLKTSPCEALEVKGTRFDLGKEEEYYRLIEHYLKNR
ncbi:UTP--glucose-1-phosphate uridylyltransferase [Bacillus sp. H-16]|uniref:UTP--glucose-1-phosphate uridylyltransferase n=1 Tax=Alteribacter salitolerans TaxID=2912333 RepID=UPI0019646AA1|nr:UTP--glucose-1-phosphate uridylyltransferase [Alteribacter salitolerans]MBM7096066.1 UTP--glucose-1-phosphate uridylyltransferase [Alteribacter salitolerans]